MKRHMLVEVSSTNGTTTKCGEHWKPRKAPAGHTTTGWWRQVTCAACVDAMRLTPQQLGQLDGVPR